jgi:UPF0755 protein
VRKLVVVVLVLGLLAAAVVGWAWSWYRTPLAGLDAPRTFVVAPGEGLAKVAQRLASEGIVDEPRLLSAFGRYTGRAARLRAGEYELEPGTTPEGLLEQFVQGRVLLHPITIVEGWTFAQALAEVHSQPFVTKTIDGPADETLMAKLGSPRVHPEGQLYPDTYLVARGTRDVDVLKLAHARLQDELAKAWAARAKDLPLASAYEALILASIVEKETGAPEERPRIAGLFVNRLRQGMRLQTDPTVIYGIGAAYDGNIRRRDLTTDTPYNTYTRAGLPPTPIALPGRAALEAATRPAATDELYFVASGVGDGRHVFSRTLEEHNAAVARYLARLRNASRERAAR